MSSNILGPEWHLSPDGINIITNNGTIKDPRTVLKNALDADIKSTGKAALSNELSKTQVDKIVLQIQKIRNISAPKAKEESQAAPRMLKLTLTDGESYVQAIEIVPINSISREKTAPGTKVLINKASVVSGYLLINPHNCTVLGGQVEHLHEKWVVAKSLQQSLKHVSNNGAPPWVAFGHKVISGSEDKSFKSLEKSKCGNADSEFEQQRKEAIAEASSGAVRKTFGGRVRQNVQPAQNNHQFNRGRPNERDHDKGGRKSKFAPRDDDVIEKLQKPSEKVSLFSFLEDKLPVTESKQPSAPSPSCNKNNCQNYHQKDPRIQQRSEARQQYNKNALNSYSGKGNQSSYISGGTKSSSLEQKDSFGGPKNLAPISSSSTTTSQANPRNSTISQTRNSFSNSIEGSNSSRNSQQRYPREQNTNKNRDNYNQQHYQGTHNQNQPNNHNKNTNDRCSQPSIPNNNPPYPKDYSQHSRNNIDRYSQRQNFVNQQPPHQNSSRSQQYPQSSGSYHQSMNTQPQYGQKPQPYQENAELHQLANNLSKMSVSNEFASRSLRQHLNLGPPKRQDVVSDNSDALTVGDQCLAKYWEDGKFYPATIAAITDKTYAVQFKGYGNIEEVLKQDCFSVYSNQNGNNFNYNYQQNNFSGSTMEFRSKRGPPRN